MMGLFGISEVILNVEKTIHRKVVQTKIRGLLPNMQEWKQSIMPILRGSFLGFFLGNLPGVVLCCLHLHLMPSRKKVSEHPEKFGHGAIEGVAGPESANNAAAQGAFIPLITLGVPNNGVMALMLGAMMIHGIQPGPLLMKENPDMFWGLISSMYIGNGMLLILNVPLIGLWVQVLKVRYEVLFPLILLFCLIGVFGVNNSIVEMWLMIGFGVFGYLMKKFEYEMPPLVLALILGPMFENALRQSLILFDGNFLSFFGRPISAALILAATLILLSTALPSIKKAKYLFATPN